MRLTPDVIRSAPQYMNPINERELGLRGLKIAVIENLGVTDDQFNTIDLSDNELLTIDNLPLLKRLTALLLNNNRVCKIAEKLGDFAPNLTTLMLTNNRLLTLRDLEPLAALHSLTHLSVQHNPVAKEANYRLFLIARLPKLKALDFRKVKLQERAEAKKVFGDGKDASKVVAKMEIDGKVAYPVKPSAAASASSTSAMMEEDEVTETGAIRKVMFQPLTPAFKQKIMELIKTTTSLTDIDRYDKMLTSQRVPMDFKG